MYIDLTQTKFLDDKLLENLNAENLTAIDLSFCTAVSQAGMKAMMMRMKMLENVKGSWKMFHGSSEKIRPEYMFARHTLPKEFEEDT